MLTKFYNSFMSYNSHLDLFIPNKVTNSINTNEIVSTVQETFLRNLTFQLHKKY